MFAPAIGHAQPRRGPAGAEPGPGVRAGQPGLGGGQAIAAGGSGALAQATSDLVPYAMLAAILPGTLIVIVIGPARRRLLGRLAATAGRRR